MSKTWHCIDTTQLIDSSWLQVSRNSYLLPDGREVPEYYIVKRQDSAICVCRVGDDVLLVRQYRPGISKVTLCHPGGRLELDDTSPVHGALRELLEETGLVPDKVHELGAFAQIPAVETGRVHVFVVDCNRSAAGPVSLDATEDLSAELLPLAKLETVITNGDMDCIACVAASYAVLSGNVPKAR
jgi:8-oxo-dGTP pyrophosphatase MutT (NUDIX family)